MSCGYTILSIRNWVFITQQNSIRGFEVKGCTIQDYDEVYFHSKEGKKA